MIEKFCRGTKKIRPMAQFSPIDRAGLEMNRNCEESVLNAGGF
jgi:hypothetical protein